MPRGAPLGQRRSEPPRGVAPSGQEQSGTPITSWRCQHVPQRPLGQLKRREAPSGRYGLKGPLWGFAAHNCLPPCGNLKCFAPTFGPRFVVAPKGQEERLLDIEALPKGASAYCTFRCCPKGASLLAKQGLPHRGNNKARIAPLGQQRRGLRYLLAKPIDNNAPRRPFGHILQYIDMLSPEGRRSAYCTFRCWKKAKGAFEPKGQK